jgi:hypothetical protein
MGRASGLLLASAVLVTGCDSELVTLGRIPRQDPGGSTGGASSEPVFRFSEPVLVANIQSQDKDDNPTLTADLREIYFTSTRGGNADVYVATRSSADEPFGTPARVDAVSSEKDDASPAIALDGQTLWVGQDTEDDDVEDTDIWFVTRLPSGGWSPPENATSLNSDAKDIPRQPAGSAALTIMPLGSQRNGDDYQTFFAARSGSGEFGAPMPIPELELGARVVDGFLTPDLLTLLFSSGEGEDKGDLFVVSRPNLDAPFGEPVALEDINTEHDERDPWLSPDGRRLFFTSNRGESHDIYEVAVTRE